MALDNAIDVEETQAALCAWMTRKVPGARGMSVSGVRSPGSNGFSNMTILFDASWSEDGHDRVLRLAARLKPTGESLFPEYDLGLQYDVMRALADTPVLATKALWRETDTAHLGTEFFVMEQVEGLVPSDDPIFTSQGWVMDLPPEGRALLNDNALQQLVAVHAVDWEQVGLGSVARPGDGTPVERELQHLERYYEWAADGQQSPSVEQAFDWVRGNMPMGPEPVVLSWGDSRIGNVMFNEDLTVRAVMDWEMATLASPEKDLGHWLFTTRAFTEGYGFDLPAGFPSRDELVARYTELSGYAPRNLLLYEVMAGVHTAIIVQRLIRLMIKSGIVPPDDDLAINNPFTRALVSLLGLEAPTGHGLGIITRG